MVDAVQSLDSTLPRDATVVSDVSLQFLELYYRLMAAGSWD